MSHPLTPESPTPIQGNMQEIPQLQLDEGGGSGGGGQVLEATAAPRQQGFARPARRGRGRTHGRSSSTASSGSAGSARSRASSASSESGLPSPAVSRDSSPAPPPIPSLSVSPSPSPSPAGSRSASPARSFSPVGSSLSSRSQSLLRAPRLYSSEDEEEALMAVGVVPESGGARGTTDAFLDRFAEIQKENEEASKRYEEEIRELKRELAKYKDQEKDNDSWISHIETRMSEIEAQNEALQKENAVLQTQLGNKEKEVRDLKELDRAVIEDEGGEVGEDGESVKLTPEQANSRIKQLRGEIRALKTDVKELKEQRDRDGDELEALWEKKDRAEVAEKENVELKREVEKVRTEVEKVRTEYIVLEKQLVVEREALRKYEEPAQEKLARVRDSPVANLFAMPGSPSPGDAKRGEVAVDPQAVENMEKLAEIMEDMKIKHEKELESLEIKIQEANDKMKGKEKEAESLQAKLQEANDKINTKNAEIKQLHDGVAGVLEHFEQLKEETARYKSQAAQLKESHQARLDELTAQISGLQGQLEAKEKDLLHEKEKFEAREKIRESTERDLRAQLAHLEQSDVAGVENLQKDLQEKEEEIAQLESKNERLEDQNDELNKHYQHLKETVSNYRKGGFDLPIRQAIANTQLWAERNIMRDSLESIKDRIVKIDPGELEQNPPLKAIFEELKQTRGRLKKEREDWAKEDNEITAILRRIDGHDSQLKKTPRSSRRSSQPLPGTQTEFMRRIEQLETEQGIYIKDRHEEYTAMNAKRKIGDPLTAEEEKRLHKLVKDFIEKLPDSPLATLFGGDNPQDRRKNQLWALTEQVKRLKVRKGGRDIHTWLPQLKPTIMEHKRSHTQLTKELRLLEADAEDIVQQINELTLPPPEFEETYLAEQQGVSSGYDEDEIRRQETALRKREEELRREIRFAYTRLEKVLFNRQLFEHWVEKLEKSLNDEASGLVMQVLLEFELRHLTDKESKEACFCSLFEYFFPKAYETTVVGKGGHGHGHSGKEGDGGGGKSPGPKKSEPGSARLPGTPKTPRSADLKGSYRGKRIPRDKTSAGGKQTPAGTTSQQPPEEHDDDVVVRSRAPVSVSSTSFRGSRHRSVTFEPPPSSSTTTTFDSVPEEDDPDFPADIDTTTTTSPIPAAFQMSRHRPHPRHGHGGGHLAISPSPSQSVQFFREHAYPYICQVMTSLIWFVLLLAIQPRNMWMTFSFIFWSVMGLPVYLLQLTRFYLAERGGLLPPGLAARLAGAMKSFRLRKGKGEQQPEKPTTEYVDFFEGKSIAGTSGLGIVLPKSKEVEAEVLWSFKEVPEPAPAPSASPELKLRGGGGKRGKKFKYKMRKDLTVPEDPEPASGSEQQQQPSPEEEEEEGKGSPAGGGEEAVTEPEPEPEPEPIVEGKGKQLVGKEEQEEQRLHTPTPVRVSPQLPPFMTTPGIESKGKGKEKEEELAQGVKESVVIKGDDDESEPASTQRIDLPEPEPELPPKSSSAFLTSEEKEGQSQVKGKDKQTKEEDKTYQPFFSTSPSSPSSPETRTKRTSEELTWGEAEWLSQALQRKAEEEAFKKQQRFQKWYWRVWFFIAELWSSFVQFISAYWPSLLWISSLWSSSKKTAQSTEDGSDGEDSPLRWNRFPRFASSIFPGSQPPSELEDKDMDMSPVPFLINRRGPPESYETPPMPFLVNRRGPPESYETPPMPFLVNRHAPPESYETPPMPFFINRSGPPRSPLTPPPRAPKSQFRNFVDTYIVQNLERLMFAIRKLSTASILILASFASQLVDFLQRVFSSITTFSRAVISLPINSFQNLRERLPVPVPNLKLPNQIPQISLRLSKLRPPNVNLNQVKASLPDLHLQRRKDQAKASFNRLRLPRVTLPKININPLQEIQNLKSQFQFHLPKITPPRPPSPPAIVGSLVSLFIIYTILTYLACLAERRVWASSNVTWRHAYLRDLELSQVAAAQQSPRWSSPSYIKSVFKPAPTQKVDAYVNTAYPGWSPAKVDYRLLYAPTFWNLWYLPEEVFSCAGEKFHFRDAWDAVREGYNRLIGERLDRFGEDIRYRWDNFGTGIKEGITYRWVKLPLGESIKEFAEKRRRAYEDSREALWDSFQAAGSNMGDVWGRSKDVGVSIVDGTGLGLRDGWSALNDTFFGGWRLPSWDWGSELIEKLGNLEWLNYVPSKLYSFWLRVEDIWTNKLVPFERAWTWTRDVIEAVWTRIAELVDDVLSYPRDVWVRVKGLWNETARPVRDAYAWAGGWWTKIFEGEYVIVEGPGRVRSVWVPSRFRVMWLRARDRWGELVG